MSSGVFINDATAVIQSASTSADAIKIIGDASTATDGFNYGIEFKGASTKVYATGSGGGITLDADAGTSNLDFVLRNDVEILASSGPIKLIGHGDTFWRNGTTYLGSKVGTPIATSVSNIFVTADLLAFNGSVPNINTSGDFTWQSAAVSFGQAVNSIWYNFNSTGGQTLDNLTIGKSTNTADVTIGQAHSVTGDINIVGGTIAVNNALSSGGSNTITLTSSTATTQSAAITADKLLLNGSGSYTLNNTSNNIATLAANSGAVSYVDSNAFTVGTVNATNGVTSTGTINLATQAGDMTLSQAISTTDTSSSAVILNAGKATAAGTSTGGNLLVGSTISTGVGGRATLYSGSISGSTGLTALVGSGSGSFRYNSDESTTNYTSALGVNSNYAIYREQPTLTITADDKTVTYGTAPTLTSSVSGQNGDTAGHALSTAANIAVGGSTSTSGNYIAGAHTLTASGAVDQLGYSINYTTGALTVNQLTTTISGLSTDATRVYDGGTTATVTGTTVFDNKIGSDNLSFTSIVANYADKNVGAGKTVAFTGTYSGTDASNYNFTDQTTTANITQKDLTASYAASDKTYDATTNAIVTGSSGDIMGADIVTFTESAAFDSKNVGAGKTVNVSTIALAGADAGNYNLTSTTANGIADITKKDLTASYVANNKVYDATTTASITGSSADIIGGDTVTFTESAAFDSKNVGAGKTVTVSTIALAGADAGNYNLLSTTASDTADITQKDLTASYAASDKTYDATTNAIVTGSSGDIMGADIVTFTESAAFDSKNVGANKTVNVSTIALAGADAGNYNLLSTTASDTADITKKDLTASYVANNKVYDATTTASITGSSADIIGGDTVTFTESAAFDSKNVGAGKTVNVSTIALAGADAGNYNLTSTTANGIADITKKDLTASYVANNKVYDATTTATITGSSADIIGGDTVTFTASAAFDSKNVGAGKAVNVSNIALAGADAGNYNLTSTTAASGTANITKKAIAVSGITASDKVYDGLTTSTTDGSGVTFSGLMGGDTLTLTSLSGLFADKNVANGKIVTLSSTYGGAGISNYSIIGQASTTANITPKAVTVSGLTASNKVYDANTSATTDKSGAVFTGLIGGDTVRVATLSGLFADKNVANGQTVSFTSTYGGADVANYSVTDQASTTANITTKAVTVSGITANNKTYNGNTTATTDGSGVTFTGMVSGDALTLASSSGVYIDKNVGIGKTVTLVSGYGGADATNYSFTDQNTTTATITPANLIIAANDSNKLFDNTPYTGGNGVNYSGFIAGESSSVLGGVLNYGGSSQGAVALGNYNITPSGQISPNYNIAFVDGALNISGSINKPVTGKVINLSQQADSGFLSNTINTKKQETNTLFSEKNNDISISTKKYTLSPALIDLSECNIQVVNDTTTNENKTKLINKCN